MLIRSFAAAIAATMLLFNVGIGRDSRVHTSITGTVIDQQTKHPISSANVVILGSNLGAATDENGRFTISRVPIGTYQIQVSVLGYKRLVDTVVVGALSEAAAHQYPLVEEQIQLGGVQAQIERFAHTSDVPLSTHSFSIRELKNSAGGLDDIMRAIDILPGVAQVKADQAGLLVRGGAPSENLYLVDNVDVAYINHFSCQGSGGGAISLIDMDLLSGSSFSTGGFGAQYGDRLSSVLNISLREGRTDRMHSKATISASQLGLNLEGPLTQQGSFLFSVRKSYLDLAFKLYGFSFAPNYWDFTGKATHSFGANDKFTLLVVGAIDKFNLFNDSDENRYENSRQLFNNQSHVVGGATWRHLFANGYATLTLRHSRSTFDCQAYTENLSFRFQSTSIENETSIRGDIVVQPTASTEFVAGAEFKSLDVHSTINLKSMGLFSGDRVLNGAPGKVSEYAQLTKMIANLRITLGLRGDYFSLIEQRAVVAPRLSSTLALSPVTNLTMSIGRYYQAPSYVWLTSNPFNRGLKHIGVNQFVVGIDHRVADDVNVSVEGYVKQYFNYPTSMNHPTLIMVNTGTGWGGPGEDYASFGVDSLISRGTGTAKGIEMSIQKKLSEVPCYGMMSLSYSETRFIALDGVSRPSSYDQRFVMNIASGYLIGEKWEVSGRFRLYTGRPYTPFHANGSVSYAEYNSARVDVNHQLDIRVARRWMLSVGVLETYLDVQNVYNRKPVDAPIYDERYRRTEQVPALGIVPTIGLAMQF